MVLYNKIMNLSPSQILLYKRCPRAWYYRYIKKIVPTPSPALQYGIEFHDGIEYIISKFLGNEVEPKTQTRDEIRDIIRVGFELGVLEVPKVGIVEKKISFNITEDIYMVGKIDLIDISNSCIIDHKTVADLKYALTKEQLKEDFQLNVYGYWYITSSPKEKTHINYRHNQLLKPAPEYSKKTEVVVSKEHVFDYWETHIKPVAVEIYELKQKAKDDSTFYEKNFESCGMYGGCDFSMPCDEDDS